MVGSLAGFGAVWATVNMVDDAFWMIESWLKLLRLLFCGSFLPLSN